MLRRRRRRLEVTFQSSGHALSRSGKLYAWAHLHLVGDFQVPIIISIISISVRVTVWTLIFLFYSIPVAALLLSGSFVNCFAVNVFFESADVIARWIFKYCRICIRKYIPSKCYEGVFISVRILIIQNEIGDWARTEWYWFCIINWSR